jgi:uncharacterized membrane protein YozB (DUF420 family)
VNVIAGNEAMTTPVRICTSIFKIPCSIFNIKNAFPMFSRKHFTIRKWILLTLFFFSVTFLIAYLTGWTGETKHSLTGSASLIRRGVTSIIMGLVISFMRPAVEE